MELENVIVDKSLIIVMSVKVVLVQLVVQMLVLNFVQEKLLERNHKLNLIMKHVLWKNLINHVINYNVKECLILIGIKTLIMLVQKFYKH